MRISIICTTLDNNKETPVLVDQQRHRLLWQENQKKTGSWWKRQEIKWEEQYINRECYEGYKCVQCRNIEIKRIKKVLDFLKIVHKDLFFITECVCLDYS